MNIILIAFTIILMSCGGGNTTGKPKSFQQAETLEAKTWIGARLKIKSTSGNIAYSNIFDLSASALEDSQRWREEMVPSAHQEYDHAKEITFYGNDLDARLEIAKSMNEQSITSAELIIDSEASVDFKGKWGWLGSDGAKTQKDSLPSMNEAGRVIIQLVDANIIHDFLTHKKLPVLWLEQSSLNLTKGDQANIKTQALSALVSTEYEDDVFEFSSPFVKLEALKRTYKVEEYERAIQYEYQEQLPGGRHDIGRLVTRRATCHIKMRRLAIADESPSSLEAAVEFDGQAVDHTSAWIVASKQTQMRFKQGKQFVPVNIGFHSFGNCHHASKFVEPIPGISSVNSASRIVIKANYYQRLP
tara:strand:+ start:15830 stop:16906 length:1077 start_codon:yes stop_codon:yes gene_type:complete